MKKREIKIFSASILGMCFVLTGCNLSSPTYGTGKPASLQFFEDVANITSLKPTHNNSQLVIKSHPKLVMPSPGSLGVLPLPEQDVEQDSSFNRRATSELHVGGDGRISVFPKKVSSVNGHADIDSSENISQLNATQRYEYLRRQRAQVGSAKYRQYLTEPPLSYRQRAKITPVGQQGNDKTLKEHERKSTSKVGHSKKG
ncbi:hypothetical protein [Bartonella quintana]|uniref:Lipoprotein n=2 Tax=Bartonella quintana TaxID=803 RepID=W3TVY7_BARQI|nr:hypothetical protein [Bartonella quintana]ETS13428.1 hypothetical protein Q651_00385 [Bartonella quintana BQ2-D70]ETS13913.1 hypothetical protein Q650_00529 [Bartonella quintana JK 73rel]ETS15600.1 hypothetical protein Q649_00538 [Bartonella quintana JK 73]ETS17604.1 hypothetical protein Q647_00528 [Bartonella quintana JK 7]ETS18434.1 hypothetical protein Q648_00118 [Bartonella quintana JK 12]